MKMKKIIIFSAVFSILALGSCKESFLDQDPPLYTESEDIYSSPTRIESTLRGLYAAFKNTSDKSFMGGKAYLAFDNRGDDIVNISNNLVTLFDTYNMKVINIYAECEDNWTMAYQAINKVNVFLDNLTETGKEVVPEDYEQYIAEAKFVRAISYFYLNNLYSMPYSIDPNAKSVPLRLKGETGTDNNDMPRSTVKEVYEQILADVSDISALPTTNGSYETVTRATQAAAHMLRMRVYMSMGQWENALAEGKAISGYELLSDVAAAFSSPYYTKENIFSLPMDATNRPNTQQSLAEYYYNGQIMVIDDNHGIMSKPNYSLENDKRIISFKGEDRIYLKYKDAANKLEWAPIFRYAETLLNMAECCINLNNTADAKEYLKQVRSRSVDQDTDPLKIDNLSDSDLREAIYNEKRLETLGEGIRGIDILRRGETFSKNGGAIVVGPSDVAYYVWPIPSSETLLNKELNN